MSQNAYCPECDTRIRFNKSVKIGQRITCYECGEILEVIQLRPLELDWAYTEMEDVTLGDSRTNQSHDHYADYDQYADMSGSSWSGEDW